MGRTKGLNHIQVKATSADEVNKECCAWKSEIMLKP
jgi:hypothetical protein